MNQARPPAPDALLLIAPGCPHCPTVLQGLVELVKTGAVGRLDVVNLALHPEQGERLGVRSVPWLRLGPFELEGLRSPVELKRWAERAGTSEGLADYLNELLGSGKLSNALGFIAQDPARLAALLTLLARPDTELQVRVGIGAIMEEHQGSASLQRLAEPLGVLTRHADARIRSDACHYLALSRSPAAVPYLRARLDDESPEVREVAAESLAALEHESPRRP